jgi:hypothetical protein
MVAVVARHAEKSELLSVGERAHPTNDCSSALNASSINSKFEIDKSVATPDEILAAKSFSRMSACKISTLVPVQ